MLLLNILLAVIWIILSTTRWKIHPLIALFVAALWVAISAGMDITLAIEIFSKGFGGLIGQIGLIIILGCVFGYFLEKSQVAFQIAQLIWRTFGKRFPAFSTSLMGFFVGIPVFCDSGFILLNPIGQQLSKASHTAPLTFTLSLSGGLFASHILIPPTPGPLAVIGIFQIEEHLSYVLLFGLIASIPILLVISWWANKINKYDSQTIIAPLIPTEVEENPAKKRVFWILILPLLFIALGNLSPLIEHTHLRALLKILGQPIVAISSGLALGFLTNKVPEGKKVLFQTSFIKGIEISGPILILTGAGAGFGGILKQIELESIFAQLQLQSDRPQVWLIVCFALAAFFKTAQGSSTSAMIISASMIFSILPMQLQNQPVFTALCVTAIGSGAMFVSHANDSYFWIVKEFSEINISEALKKFTFMTGIMSIIGLGTVLLMSWLFLS